MLKKNYIKIIISCLLTLSPIAFGLAVWNQLPEVMATHWGILGDADGFSSRTFAVFGLPLILLVLNILCIVTGAFDKRNCNPKVQNIRYFLVPVISIVTNAMVYCAAFGKTWDLSAVIPLLLGALFAIMGNLMPKIRQNATMGFKYKWTLQSESNWNATHRFGGKVMVCGGILILFTVFLPLVAMFITTMAIILASLIITVIYSYNYYKKELEYGYTDFESIYNKKSYKIATIIALIAVPLIIIGITFLMFTGNIEITYTDDSFTVDSTYYDPLTINYLDIDNIEIFENDEIGSKEFGFNSAKLSLGKFNNKQFNSHTRYTYNGCKTIVAIESNGKTLLINDTTPDLTREIYIKILGELQADSGFIVGEGEEI